MRPIERIDDIQDKITMIWKRYPDMRYFQFISFLSNAISLEMDLTGDLFFVEDKVIDEALDRLCKAMEER